MSYNWHAEQYDDAYRPHRLCNWGPPRWSPSKPRPADQRPRPAERPLADYNGRLLPGFKRPRGATPWAQHVGTWDMPHIITRKDAANLSKEPPPGRFLNWTKRSAHTDFTGKAAPTKGRPKRRVGAKIGGDDVQSQRKYQYGEKPVEADPPAPVDSEGHTPYIPGRFTEPAKRHESHDKLVDRAVEDIHGPQPTPEERFLKNLQDAAAEEEEVKPPDKPETEGDDLRALYENMRDKGKRTDRPEEKVSLLPRVTGYGYQYARKLHMDNLLHQPLPDTIADRMYQKMQLEYPEKAEGSEIIVKPYAVAWKGHGSQGPNGCTKMRVHRPKTCSNAVEMPDIKQKISRPATSAGDKVQVQKLKNMSQMDLAICWDFRPFDPKIEPKRPTHIDGSNGSKAPAVFTLVQTPREETMPPLSGRNAPEHPNAIFTQNVACDTIEAHKVPYFERDMSKNKKKESCDVPKCRQHDEDEGSASSGRKSNRSRSSRSSRSHACDGVHGCGTSAPRPPRHGSSSKHSDKLAPLKAAWGDTEKYERKENVPPPPPPRERRNSLTSPDRTLSNRAKMHRSSPNLSEDYSIKASKGSSTQTACQKKCKNHKYCEACRNKTATKKSNGSSDSGNHTGGVTVSSGTKSSLKIPKMRDPYSKKNYIIPTLSSPFSLWKDASSNNGYPEHWRLASVYQHAYKPVEQRRKPLIASVYQ